MVSAGVKRSCEGSKIHLAKWSSRSTTSEPLNGPEKKRYVDINVMVLLPQQHHRQRNNRGII